MPTRRNWMTAALSLIILTAAAAGGTFGDEPKVEGDLKKLQGKWTAKAQNGDSVTYTFKGKTLKVEAPTRSYTITATIDEAAKPEKSVDLKIEEGPEDAKGKTCKGIYKFDGDDKFIFCFRAEGDRPSKFEMVGFEQILVETTRAKD